MDELRKSEGFEEEKLFVLPAYHIEELSRYELTRGLFVSDIGFFPEAQYHYRERPDGCDAHIFIYCLRGEGWLELNGRTVPVPEHHLAVIPAGAAHRYGASAARPWSIYWFHLKGEHVADYIQLYGLDSGPLPLPAALYAEWADNFSRCFELLTDKPYSMPVQVHVSQSMGQLLGRIGLGSGGTARDRKKRQDLERAIQYMSERLSDVITLPELAAHTGLSKQHLIFMFNQETGFPPIEYFLRMKMQKAGQLLSLTSLTVKEIAASVGVSDPYYFSRLFKKRMGASPTEYRSAPKG
ncbi:AraC family transcriptional regulator [Paenibacillus radicis (ex Gao et al. 2016)]|uniref:Transcriptional regulator n=1 Tax=Paenibacillus radicis (ex Gao et al. 2016) TaxID=1737354 RepID=A0A917LWT3_9BACL|nr:AraC family transcriptional regulator [Paenibacillus radicis (ex Gao et al. 2016)]GGG62612.1 transcriptional regulator [Paenibacillus radicis (ex Gao et al. 2016)]